MTNMRDSVDRSIIALLQEDARLTTSEISRRLGMARSTVTERIARLEQNDIIRGYSAIVSPEPQLQETRAYISLRCDRAARRAVIVALKGFPEILECASISGDFDLMCTVTTPCAEDIDALLDDLSELRGVISLEARIVFCQKFVRGSIAATCPPSHIALVG